MYRSFLTALVALSLLAGDALHGEDARPMVTIWPELYRNPHHSDNVFSNRNVRKWPFVLSHTDVVFFGEYDLFTPAEGGGMSDAWWSRVLKFCKRKGKRIAIVGWFGGYCGDPGFPPEVQQRFDPATVDGYDAWARDPVGGGKPCWARLARLCDRNRVPRSIVYAYALDSPHVYNLAIEAACRPDTEDVRIHLAHEMMRYVSFAKSMFPGIVFIDQDAPHAFDVTQFQWEGTYDWTRMTRDVLDWVDVVNAEATAMGIEYILSVDTLRESGVDWCSYDPPYDKAYYLALKAIFDGLRDRGVKSTLEVEESNLSIMNGPSGIEIYPPSKGAEELYNWVELAMIHYGFRPDILEFLPYNGSLKYNLPESTPGIDPVRDFTLTKTMKEILQGIVPFEQAVSPFRGSGPGPRGSSRSHRATSPP